MSRKYKFRNPDGVYFVSFATVGWAQVYKLAPSEDYHLYEVIKPLPVQQSTVAPWFGQPGYGTQYKMYLPIQELNDFHFLKL